ncbi:MAG: hypothetical protein Q7T97_09940 [Burkholderiaceae bacterium]|nr:hypothetical protein [Burkholderiaceae bacterium]
MTDNAESVLPDSIRDHPFLTRLRSSLLSQAPDQARLDAADPDPVTSALSLSDMLPESPGISG